MLYFDHNATTPVRPGVLDVVARAQRDVFGNPSSQHRLGRRARALLEESRERVGAVLDVAALELVFTSGGTEANLLALELGCRAASDRPLLAVSALEHASILDSCRYLEARQRAKVQVIASESSGRVSLSGFEAQLRPETSLLALQHANNETGMLQPVTEAAALCHTWRAERRGRGLLLCDATQTLGKIPVDPVALGVDLLSFSSHKIGGPKGAGALWIRPGCLHNVQRGGGPQERGVRPGTENLPAIVGFAEALELASAAVGDDTASSGFAELVANGLAARLDGLHLHGGPGPRLGNTVNVSFEGVPADLLIIRLDEEGVAVSTGSACASGAREPSHVLQAMGVPADRLKGAVRFSAGWSTTSAEIQRLLDVVAGVVTDLRGRLATS